MPRCGTLEKMKISQLIIIVFGLISISACGQKFKKEITVYEYFDMSYADTTVKNALIAVTDEELLQYGSKVAYLNIKGDTIIPFGKYGYLGTDTLIHFAKVFEYATDSSNGRQIVTKQSQKYFIKFKK